MCIGYLTWHAATSALEMKGSGNGPKLRQPRCPEPSELEWLPGEPFSECILSSLKSTGDLNRVWGPWITGLGPSMFAGVPVWTKFILAALRQKAPYPISSPLKPSSLSHKAVLFGKRDHLWQTVFMIRLFVVVVFPADVKLLSFTMKV